MPYFTFRDVQLKATEAGLVMSRRDDGIYLRYRDPNVSSQTWSGLTFLDARSVVDAEATKIR